MRKKATIKMKIQKKYLLFIKKLKLLIFLFLPLPTPKGVPHELHTNLPDNARSARRLELPQTKHLFAVIKLN